jgi:hypothetical protein
MTETITDPESIVLAGEIEDLQMGITATEQRIEDLGRELLGAQDAEGEAMALLERARSVAHPLLEATREGEGQQALFVGDSYWRARWPSAADGFDKAMAAEEARTTASARVIRISKEIDRQRYGVLPALHGQLDAKQAELEQHQRTQAAAVEKARGWRDRLRGKA